MLLRTAPRTINLRGCARILCIGLSALFGVLAFRNNPAIPYCMFFVPRHQHKKQVALDLLFAFLLLRFDSATMPDSAT